MFHLAIAFSAGILSIALAIPCFHATPHLSTSCTFMLADTLTCVLMKYLRDAGHHVFVALQNRTQCVGEGELVLHRANVDEFLQLDERGNVPRAHALHGRALARDRMADARIVSVNKIGVETCVYFALETQ